MRAQIQEDEVSQYWELRHRLDQLELSINGAVELFPVGDNLVDVSVPPESGLAVLDFEYEVPFGSSVLLRPNGDSSTLLNTNQGLSSTAAPDNPGSWIFSQSSLAGLLVNGDAGSSGVLRVVGRATVQTRSYTGRTMICSEAAYTNSAGSSNLLVIRLHSQAVYDLSSDVTSLRFITSTGDFNGGAVRARFT